MSKKSTRVVRCSGWQTLPLLMCFLSAPLFAHAAEKMARIDLAGNTAKPVDLEIVALSQGGLSSVAGWANKAEDQKRCYTLEFPATKNWREGSITVKPLQSGRAALVLMGPYAPVFAGSKELVPVLVEYDHFTVEGAVLKNASFESLYGGDKVDGWTQGNSERSNPPLNDDLKAKPLTEEAEDGKYCVRVWHNSTYAQSFEVTAGMPVTIHFYYRLGR